MVLRLQPGTVKLVKQRAQTQRVSETAEPSLSLLNRLDVGQARRESSGTTSPAFLGGGHTLVARPRCVCVCERRLLPSALAMLLAARLPSVGCDPASVVDS